MSLEDDSRALYRRLLQLAIPIVWDDKKAVGLTLKPSELRVLLRATEDFAEGDDGWEPIATLPTGREWDIRDEEMNESVSLARDVGTGEPLFFIYQEKLDGIYEQTMWRPLTAWPSWPKRHRDTSEEG